jgi:ADP-sugar diphosphatase
VEELSVVDRSGATKTEVVESTALPGICLLRGHAVSILVALLCTREERLDANCWDDSAYCLLVDQPRIPIGQVSCLELPAGMMEGGSIAGTAVMELREECGIEINPEDVVDLTALAFSDAPAFTGEGDDTLALLALPNVGLPPSPGGCDERIRYLYLERRVTQEELDSMKGRLTGLREHGEVITLRVVPMQDVWKVSRDAKAIMYVLTGVSTTIWRGYRRVLD